MKNLTKTILLATSIGVGAIGLSVSGNWIRAEARKLYSEKNNPTLIETADKLTTYGDILHGLALLTSAITAPLLVYRHNKNREEERKLNLRNNYRVN